MEEAVASFAASIAHNLWVGPLIAFVAGIAASFTPCCLSSVPLVVGYVSGYSGEDRRAPLIYSLTYASGAAITLVVLGVLTAAVGEFLHEAGRWWYLLLAALMVVMALQLWGKIHLLPHLHHLHRSRRRGLAGALLLGMVGGAFSSPCSTPVLIAILAVVAGGGVGVLAGALMLLAYAVGHSLLVVIAGASAGWALGVVESPSAARFGRLVTVGGGWLMLLFAVFLVWLSFVEAGH